MKNIGEVLQLSIQFLADRGIERARRLSEELLASVLGMRRMDLYIQFDKPVEEKELGDLRQPLRRLARGEPLEYVQGSVEFYGCKIAVDSRVLIPRPETEILVEHVLKNLKGNVVWDLCTGSGCIGIAIKKARPELEVTLSDVSEEALAVAKNNAAGLDVRVVRGDLLTPFHGQTADVIVCNPPYVSTNEYLNLSPSVKDFEPKLALVGGDEGTEFYQRLSAGLPPFLNPGGQVFLEIGAGQGDALKKIFAEGSWSRRELITDWAGHDRFFFLEK